MRTSGGGKIQSGQPAPALAVARKLIPEYGVWKSMRGRCMNSNNPAYDRYGGRGISVCERWNDFLIFLADMGQRPKGLSLDRIDNSKGYDPSNCRWATAIEQRHNRRDIHPNSLTHCSHNHEFTPENTYRSKNGAKYCRECHRLHARANWIFSHFKGQKYA